MTDDTPALRVRFFGAHAAATTQMYWRGPVLWDFDGRTWTQPTLAAAASVRRPWSPAPCAGITRWRWSPPTAANWSRSTCRSPRPPAADLDR